jgi:hypothetical protein
LSNAIDLLSTEKYLVFTKQLRSKEMSELDEAISESMEHANESKLNAKIALFVALTATFMAICNIKGGNIVQNMAKAQSKSVSGWSYFQSKSTKQNLSENTVEILSSQLLNTNTPKALADIEKKIAKYKEKIAKYEIEKNEIKTEAESQEKAYDDMNVFDDQFDMTEAILSISIAMFGLSALTQKKQLFYFALSLSSLGIILGLSAFLKIPLHSGFISNILG